MFKIIWKSVLGKQKCTPKSLKHALKVSLKCLIFYNLKKEWHQGKNV